MTVPNCWLPSPPSLGTNTSSPGAGLEENRRGEREWSERKGEKREGRREKEDRDDTDVSVSWDRKVGVGWSLDLREDEQVHACGHLAPPRQEEAEDEAEAEEMGCGGRDTFQP